VLGAIIEAVRGRLKIRLVRLKDVGHVLLGVAVDERKPRALYLHHEPVAGTERVQQVLQRNGHGRDLTRYKGPGLTETLTETAAHDFGAHQLLVAAQVHARRRARVVWRVVGLHVDDFHDPVGVGAGGGNLQQRSEIVPFSPISAQRVERIFDIQLQQLIDSPHHQGIRLDATAAVQQQLARSGYSPQYGARPLAGVIRNRLRRPISKMIISGELTTGDILSVDWNFPDSVIWNIIKEKDSD
jgi:hypothetical protein